MPLYTTSSGGGGGGGTGPTGPTGPVGPTGPAQFVLNGEFDGGGSVIPPGLSARLRVPYTGTIDSAHLWDLDGNTGSLVVDVCRDSDAAYPPTGADSITGGNPITISSARKVNMTTLTGWTTAVTAGDFIAVSVTSATTITRVALQLIINRTA